MNVSTAERLFYLFKKNLTTKEKIKKNDLKHSYLFHCPNKKCGSNTIGHRSYKKNKFSVTFGSYGGNCWVCSYSGNLFEIAKEYFDVADYKEIRQLLKSNNNNNSGTGHKRVVRRVYQQEKPLDFSSYGFKPIVSNDISLYKNYALQYLVQERCIPLDIVQYYNISYHPIDKIFKHCIIVPSYNKDLTCNYYVARDYRKKLYYNPEINKNNIIFNEYLIDFNKELILVEGVFDYLRLHGRNRTILFGSSLSKYSKLFKEIVRNKTPIALLLDNDAISKMRKLADALLEQGIQVSVYNIDELNVKDIAEVTLPEIVDKFINNNKQQKNNMFDIIRDRIANI